MKFAHVYEVALKEERYPKHWVELAISYKQLKKCVKQVQQELFLLGLSPEAIAHLWHANCTQCSESGNLNYSFTGGSSHSKPTLSFLVKENIGSSFADPLHHQTSSILEYLIAHAVTHSNRFPTDSEVSRRVGSRSHIEVDVGKECHTSSKTLDDMSKSAIGFREKSSVFRKFEIPLMWDSLFFRTLSDQILGLSNLQSTQKAELIESIDSLGQSISPLAEPSSSIAKTDLIMWRTFFNLYTDSQIFFSTNERNPFRRDGKTAESQMKVFLDRMQELRLPEKLKKKESQLALQRFLIINETLLQSLKFYELNMTAMTKILKSSQSQSQLFERSPTNSVTGFDKRTALQARQAFSESNAVASLSSSAFAKAICFQVGEKILAAVPRLDDHLCPVCFSISYKPIRLRCGHVFCIRCMIIMQRAYTDHCPLCRGSVVMEADSSNLDTELMKYLQSYFNAEVRIKQKENEHNAAVDKYGINYSKCHIM